MKPEDTYTRRYSLVSSASTSTENDKLNEKTRGPSEAVSKCIINRISQVKCYDTVPAV